MFQRLCKPLHNNSFFLFGARGTGKSTLVRSLFPEDRTLYLDLLDADIEDEFDRRPQLLAERLRASANRYDWVIIDEVQRIPRLLDVVHAEIERGQHRFALTGSSARKLRRGASNLLAGRAFVYNLFPLTHRELGEVFSLDRALHWGTLPRAATLSSDEERREYLTAYARTYLKEEIAAEQVLRKLRPFRQFLEVAAQASGTILNHAAIARDVQVDGATVRSYFEVLEDTLLGFLLPAYHRSIRKRQRQGPKFYFFDEGVRKALQRTLSVPPHPRTSEYGRAFEGLVINEVLRAASYARKDFSFSYFQSRDGVEIDLVVERPGLPLAIVEIKSTAIAREEDVRALLSLRKELTPCETFCLSLDPAPRRIGPIHVLPWQEGVAAIVA